MQQRLIILGDERLVHEYSAACSEKGFHLVTEGEADLALELTNLSIERKKTNLARIEAALSPRASILSSSVTVTVAEQARWLKHPSRLIGLGAFPTLLQGSLIEFVAGNRPDDARRTAAEQFAASLGKAAACVDDCVGMVMPRILCMLINEAFFAMTEGVADDAAIDTAMKLGTNYPHGPVEWGRTAGLEHVVAVIRALHHHFAEDRYRCAPLLVRTALMDVGER